MENQPVLHLKNISKRFAGIQALHNADLSVSRGEIHALLGANGAGKSTMIKIITGVHESDSGEIVLNGEVRQVRSPIDAKRNGITAIYQELSLVESLTVAENIFLGNEPTMGGAVGVYDRKTIYRRSQEALDRFGIDIDARSPLSSLGMGQKRIVEIVKALMVDAQILLLDEPTTGMSQSETEHLFSILRSMKEKQVTMVYISHYLDEIFRICDRATVLRDGEVVAVRDILGIDKQVLIRDMLGKERLDRTSGREARDISDRPIILELKKYRSNIMQSPISLNLRQTEILGITGIVGAGKSELAQSIFGNAVKMEGEIKVNGEVASVRSPFHAKRWSLALVPEDRKTQGLFLDRSVAENLVITSLKETSNALGIQSRKKSEKIAFRTAERVHLRPLNIKLRSGNLSGGNQQKVVLGKWLSSDSKILLMDEPTRGIDVGAKTEIYKMIRELAEQGKSLILFSSEYEELMGLCDRIIVIRRGEIVGELHDKDITSENLLSLSLGG